MNQLILHHTFAQEWPLTYPITAPRQVADVTPDTGERGMLRKMIRHRMLGRPDGQAHQRRFTPSGKEFNSSLLLLPMLRDAACRQRQCLQAEPGS